MFTFPRGRGHGTRRVRSGLTLIELLIVVTILLLLTAVTLPALGPVIRGEQVRQGTRTLSAFLAAARARAAERGRPVGVMFERFAAANGVTGLTAADQTFQFSARAYLCEVPPPFSGNTFGAKVFVKRTQIPDQDGDRRPEDVGLITSFEPPLPPNQTLIRSGDVIRLNYQSAWYRIYLDDNSTYLPAPTANAPWQLWPVSRPDPRLPSSPEEPLASPVWQDTAVLPFLPYDGAAVGYEFQILRQPVKSVSEVRQLPGACVVDLQMSGFEGDDHLHEGGIPHSTFASFSEQTGADLRAPVVIMFSPDGSLEQVYVGGVPQLRATESVYLLVGRREKVLGGVMNLSQFTAQSTSRLHDPTQALNYLDPEGRWIAIDHLTGKITTTEVNANASLVQKALNNEEGQLSISRQFAREGNQPLGGTR